MRSLLDVFRPGRTIYLPGASGELLALADALALDPDRLEGVHLVSCLLPGMNTRDYGSLHQDVKVTTFLLPPGLRGSFEAGRTHILPLSYRGAADHLQRIVLDVAIAHVAPPGRDGFCSVGVAADFSPIAWERAAQRVAVVNPTMPPMRRGPKVRLADATLVAESDGPLVTGSPRVPNATLGRIARSAAALIPDGAAIQVGIGGAPDAVWDALREHRGLRVQSGLVGEGVTRLADAGALSDGPHSAGVAFGDLEFYERLSSADLIAFADARFTHDSARLGDMSAFTATNSALEVDLFGQVNLEWRSGRLRSVSAAPRTSVGPPRPRREVGP